MLIHGRRNSGGGQFPTQYFANQKNMSLKIMTYKSMYSNKAKIGSVDFEITDILMTVVL